MDIFVGPFAAGRKPGRDRRVACPHPGAGHKGDDPSVKDRVWIKTLYWEGPITFEGHVKIQGYLEMTGYE